MIAIYARQSIDKKDSISIDTQIDFGKREAIDAPFEIYQDKGYSGKNINRPEFTRMMNDVKAGKINKVVVYRLDRVSRSIVDFADFINTLEGYNTSFVSATEKFDTSNPMGRAMLYIVVVFAQLERETIAERIKDNYYARVKNGAIGGGRAPYGFDLVKKDINGTRMAAYEPNDNLRNVIEIFNEYAKPHTSLADVQRYLIDKGVYTSTGCTWSNPKLATLLKSPGYVKADLNIYNYYKSKGVVVTNPPEEFNGINGCVLVGKRNPNERKYNDVSDHVLAISTHRGVIDSDTFLYVQHKFKGNIQIKNTNKGKHSWLTGHIKCGICGYAFSVRISTAQKHKTASFVCSGKYLHRVCTVGNHRVTEVEAAVENKMIDYICSTPPVNDVQEKTGETTLQKKIRKVDAKINALILGLEDSTNVTASYINQRIAELDGEKQGYLAQQTTDLIARKEAVTLPEYDLSNLQFEQKRELARLLIQKVVVNREDIDVYWK